MTPRMCITDRCPGWVMPGELACFACDVEARGGPSAYYMRGPVTLYKGDVREVSPWWRRRGKTIWDPPYSRYVHEKSRAGARDTVLRNGNGTVGGACISRAVEFGFDSLSPSFRRYMAAEAVRLTDGWAMVFSDSESSHLWRASLMAAGDPELERRILIAEMEAEAIDIELPGMQYVRTMFWNKLCGSPQFTGTCPAVACEAITLMHAVDKAMSWNGGGKRGIYDVATVLDRGGKGGNDPRLHTTQKPKPLLIEIEQDFTNAERALADAIQPADTIYDFCAGVCTSGVAAISAEGGPRFWVGCELDPEVPIDECRVCGRDAKAHGDHPFADNRKTPGRCRACGNPRDAHTHPFDPKIARVWAERGALRLDAELSGSTFGARSSGQTSIFDLLAGAR